MENQATIASSEIEVDASAAAELPDADLQTSAAAAPAEAEPADADAVPSATMFGASEWFAKILSGAHKDVEIKLQPGRQTIGNHEDCDIVLWDDDLPGALLAIDVVAGDVHIDLLAAGTTGLSLNNQEIPEAKLALAEPAVISAGGLKIGFYREGETLSTVNQEAVDHDAHAAADGNHDASDPAQGPSQAQAPAGQSSDKNLRVKRVFFPITLLMVATVIGLWIFDGPTDTPEGTPVATQAAEVLKEQQATGVTLQRRGEQVVFKGFVRTKAMKQNLLGRLLKKGLAVDAADILVLEEQQALARAALDGLGYSGITVTLGDNDETLVVKGYVPEATAWSEAKKRLLVDVPLVPHWQDLVGTRQSRVADLESMIAAAGLSSKIGLIIKEQQIEVRGMFDTKDSRVWQELQQRFIKKYGNEPLLVAAKPEIENLAVRSVTLGTIPYLTLATGEVMMKGAKLKNNYTLKSIYQDRIVLERDGELINYMLNDNVK